jgi:hypothetical protein
VEPGFTTLTYEGPFGKRAILLAPSLRPEAEGALLRGGCYFLLDGVVEILRFEFA